MESSLKQRLIGAAVLVALAVIFLPMLLKGPDVKEPDAAQVPLSMPAAPGQEYETRELPLNAPEGTTPPGGVLGMKPAEPEPLPPPAPEAAATAAPVAASSSTVAAAPAPVPPSVVTPPAPTPAKPTVAPAEAAPTAATVAAGDYVVNIGSFSNLDNASALVAKLRAQKLPVLADKVSLANGSGMRVRVGPYPDRATAEAARLRAEGVTGTAGRVVTLDVGGGEAAGRASALAATPKPAAAAPATAAAKPAAPATATAAPKPVAPAPAAASEPKPAPGTNSNASGVGFAVQLSAPSVEADANALRDKARAQGFSSFVQPVETESGKRYRVRVGPVADRAAAEALRDDVNGKLGSKGIVVANP